MMIFMLYVLPLLISLIFFSAAILKFSEELPREHVKILYGGCIGSIVPVINIILAVMIIAVMSKKRE